MKLNKLSLKNIRSYKLQEIDFPIGSTLLAGDIGAGKTTVLLAIEFALFGLQPGQRGSSLLANGEESGIVSLECEIEGDIISIERRLKRGSKSISNDYAAITLDGETIESSVTELKTKILELLGYPDEFVKKTNLLYRYTVYSPQEEMKQIILEDAETRLDILRHIFGIDKYRKIKDNLLIVGAHLRERARSLQFEAKDIEIYKSKLIEGTQLLNLVEKKIKESDELIVQTKAKRKTLEKERDALKEKLVEKQTLEKEVEKANVLLSNKGQYLFEHEKELRLLEASVADQRVFDQKMYDSLLSEIFMKKKEVEEYHKNIIEISSSINSINLKKQEDAERKRRIFNIDICPTCLQDVSESHKNNILNETEGQMAKAERQISDLIKALEKNKVFLDQLKKHIEGLEKNRAEIEILRIKTQDMNLKKNKIEEIKKQRDTIKKDVQALDQHIMALKKSLFELSKFDNLLRIKEEELRKAFGEEKRVEIGFAELKKEQEFTIREQNRLNEEIRKKEALRVQYIKMLELEKWLSEDFSKLISFAERNIMLKVRDEFSRLFNKWFAMLTTDAFSVKLDENFT